jgi:hypothetical protein
MSKSHDHSSIHDAIEDQHTSCRLSHTYTAQQHLLRFLKTYIHYAGCRIHTQHNKSYFDSDTTLATFERIGTSPCTCLLLKQHIFPFVNVHMYLRAYVCTCAFMCLCIPRQSSRFSLHQSNSHQGYCPIEYYNRKMSPAETLYPTCEQELLAIKDAFAHWTVLQVAVESVKDAG